MAQEKSGSIETWRAKLEKALHEKNPFTDILAKAEEKTKVKRIYLVSGLAAVTALWLIVGYGAAFLANFIGFLYPAYASVKAIESHDKLDDTKWLTYWVVYSLFSLVELFTDIFLFWIPFYWLLKCIFLLYCMVPTRWNGSIAIYDKIIRPYFLKHQSRIDENLDKAADYAGGLLSEASAIFKRSAKKAEKMADEASSDAAKRYMDSYKTE